MEMLEGTQANGASTQGTCHPTIPVSSILALTNGGFYIVHALLQRHIPATQ